MNPERAPLFPFRTFLLGVVPRVEPPPMACRGPHRPPATVREVPETGSRRREACATPSNPTPWCASPDEATPVCPVARGEPRFWRLWRTSPSPIPRQFTPGKRRLWGGAQVRKGKSKPRRCPPPRLARFFGLWPNAHWVWRPGRQGTNLTVACPVIFGFPCLAPQEFARGGKNPGPAQSDLCAGEKSTTPREKWSGPPATPAPACRNDPRRPKTPFDVSFFSRPFRPGWPHNKSGASSPPWVPPTPRWEIPPPSRCTPYPPSPFIKNAPASVPFSAGAPLPPERGPPNTCN